MQLLKQSTAIYIQAGPFVDSVDAVTAETGLTIAQADVQLSKNGAAFAQKNDANSCTHDADGWYRCQLDTTDTGTLGRLQLQITVSGALPVWLEFMVVTANIYDTLCSTDHFDVELADDAITAAKFDEATAFPVTSADSGATAIARVGADSDTLETLSDQIDGVGGGSAADIADAVWDEASADHVTTGTMGKALANAAAALGAGAIAHTYTLTSSVDSSPIPSASVWATTDNDPAGNIVASGTTNASGQIVFYLTAGTYYFWRHKPGYNFTNPDIEVVA